MGDQVTGPFIVLAILDSLVILLLLSLFIVPPVHAWREKRKMRG
jgi:hypothetical protein